MSHEKVFGFCENLCETEVEQISNKVTSMSSSSTDEQYPSAKAVYDELNQCEQISNKVISISNESTHDEYPSAKTVYNVLSQFLGGGTTPWVNTLLGCAEWYFYEGADTLGYNIPVGNCIVLVFNKSNSRGVAFAFGWDWDGVSPNKTLWKNTNHDGWRGWAQLHTN